MGLCVFPDEALLSLQMTVNWLFFHLISQLLGQGQHNVTVNSVRIELLVSPLSFWILPTFLHPQFRFTFHTYRLQNPRWITSITTGSTGTPYIWIYPGLMPSTSPETRLLFSFRIPGLKDFILKNAYISVFLRKDNRNVLFIFFIYEYIWTWIVKVLPTWSWNMTKKHQKRGRIMRKEVDLKVFPCVHALR